MDAHTHTRMITNINAYTCVYTFLYKCLCAHIYIYIYIYIPHMYINTYMHMHTCMHACSHTTHQIRATHKPIHMHSCSRRMHQSCRGCPHMYSLPLRGRFVYATPISNNNTKRPKSAPKSPPRRLRKRTQTTLLTQTQMIIRWSKTMTSSPQKPKPL